MDNPRLICQTVFDLALDSAHASAVTSNYKQLLAADLVVITPINLALLYVLICITSTFYRKGRLGTPVLASSGKNMSISNKMISYDNGSILTLNRREK